MTGGAADHPATDAGPESGAGPVSSARPGAGPAARARREVAGVLAVGTAGAALALLAGSQVWLRLAALRRPPLPDVSVALSGRAVEPLVPALGVVGLAGLVALLATRGRGRLAVGALLAASGLVLALRAVTRVAGPDPAAAWTLLTDTGRASGLPPATAVVATVSPAWPLLAAAGGLALLAAGAAALLRGRRWPAMSARYDAPAGPPASVPQQAAGPAPDAVWDALDRGDDPTAG
jgi:uncharacterized membrane protein (TIGR02234 family)